MSEVTATLKTEETMVVVEMPLEVARTMQAFTIAAKFMPGTYDDHVEAFHNGLGSVVPFTFFSDRFEGKSERIRALPLPKPKLTFRDVKLGQMYRYLSGGVKGEERMRIEKTEGAGCSAVTREGRLMMPVSDLEVEIIPHFTERAEE